MDASTVLQPIEPFALKRFVGSMVIIGTLACLIASVPIAFKAIAIGPLVDPKAVTVIAPVLACMTIASGKDLGAVAVGLIVLPLAVVD